MTGGNEQAGERTAREPGGAATGPGERAGRRITQERLTIKLDGPGIVDGVVNARALAKVLASASDLVQASAGTGEFKEHAPPELKVAATHEGSFEVVFVLEALGEWWAAIRNTFAGDDATAAANLAALVAAVGGGLSFLVRRGKRLVESVRARADGTIAATLEDGEVVAVEPDAFAVAQTPAVQLASKALASAAQLRGVDNLYITAETVNIHINAETAERLPEPSEAPTEEEGRTSWTWATFTRPDFGGDKWKMEEAGTKARPRQVIIKDADFLKEVESGSVSLNRYSEFRVELQEEPYRTESGQTRFRRYVTRILDSRDSSQREAPIPGIEEPTEDG